MIAIDIENLQKRFGWFLSFNKVTALEDLSLSVPENCIFGFLGPNGAGKTTTIKILLGLIIANSGTTRIFGHEAGDAEARSRIGYLPENPQFYPHLSARGYLDFCGKILHMESLDRAKKAEELLERVNMVDAGDQKLKGFSRGMLQRIGIAQTLISDPDLIILDEPITGLDPMGRRDIKEILLGLKEEGKTVFFSSHILSDVETMCGDIAIINKGKLVEAGSIEKVLGDGGVEIVATDVPTDKLKVAEELSESVTMKDGAFRFTTHTNENKLTETLKEAGANIVEVLTLRKQLEEHFLTSIKEDNEKRFNK